MLDTIKCPKCGAEMAVYGITDKGDLKYYCRACHFMYVLYKVLRRYNV